MKLNDILKVIGIEGKDSREILNVTCDSEKVDSQSIFVAIQGVRFDSHIYLEKATSLGGFTISNYGMGGDIEVANTQEIYAPLVLALKGNLQTMFTFVGITGTNGKSSVGYAVYTGLLALGHAACFVSTDGIFLKDMCIETHTTTPSIDELVVVLETCKEESITHIVMEVSSHSLAQYRLNGILFDVFVYTNLGHDHLDYHGSFMDYFEAKKKGVFYVKDMGKVLLSLDPLLQLLIPFIPVSYSIVGEGDYEYSYEWKEDGVSLLFRNQTYSLPLYCDFQVVNLMLAVGVLLQLECEERVLSILGECSTMPGRMECVYQGEFTVFVDYAHTVEAYLTLGKHLSRYRDEKWIVFGLGGDRDQVKRPWIGSIVDEYFDHIVLTSDNPRGEDVLEICNMIKQGIEKECVIILNREDAINYALLNVSKHGIIVVAGKGNESFMKCGSEIVAFKDSEVIYRSLVKRGFIHAI